MAIQDLAIIYAADGKTLEEVGPVSLQAYFADVCGGSSDHAIPELDLKSEDTWGLLFCNALFDLNGPGNHVLPVLFKEQLDEEEWFALTSEAILKLVKSARFNRAELAKIEEQPGFATDVVAQSLASQHRDRMESTLGLEINRAQNRILVFFPPLPRCIIFTCAYRFFMVFMFLQFEHIGTKGQKFGEANETPHGERYGSDANTL